MSQAGTAHFSAHREPSAMRSLTALLHVGTHEFLGVLLQDLVDLVEDRIDVVGQLLVPLLDLLDRTGLGLLGLLGAAVCLPLPTGVLRCHRLPPSGGDSPPTTQPVSSPAAGRSNPLIPAR